MVGGILGNCCPDGPGGRGVAAGEEQYRYTAEFSGMEYLVIDVSADLASSADLSNEECVEFVKDLVYAELRAKLPAVRAYKEGDALIREVDRELRRQGALDETGKWNGTGDSPMVVLLERMGHAGYLTVSVIIDERPDSGYYGNVSFYVARWVRLEMEDNNGEARTFLGTVYRNGYSITKGVSHGVKDHVRQAVQDLVLEFVSDFYEARGDV
ncbi:MAG: hypothetical protein ACM3TT_11245 [Syntrophothermus sp.]